MKKELSAFWIVSSLFIGACLVIWSALSQMMEAGESTGVDGMLYDFNSLWASSAPYVAGIVGIPFLVVGVWLLLRNHRIRQEAAR